MSEPELADAVERVAESTIVHEVDPDALLVDSAISHLEKLRRVLELEEWIVKAGGDALFAATRRAWRLERERLMQELGLTETPCQ
jgi:hypothetical protein